LASIFFRFVDWGKEDKLLDHSQRLPPIPS